MSSNCTSFPSLVSSWDRKAPSWTASSRARSIAADRSAVLTAWSQLLRRHTYFDDSSFIEYYSNKYYYCTSCHDSHSVTESPIANLPSRGWTCVSWNSEIVHSGSHLTLNVSADSVWLSSSSEIVTELLINDLLDQFLFLYGQQTSPVLSIVNANPPILPFEDLVHSKILANRSSDIAYKHLWHDHSLFQLSFSDLNAIASSLAVLIPENCATPIPIMIPQCPAYYLSLLATLHSGLAFCPIRTDSPQKRVHFICNDVKATAAFCTPAYRSLFPSHIHIIELDETLNDFQRFLTKRASTIAKPVSPDSCAYVMYTSGSTGDPKGVQVSHKNIVQTFIGHNSFVPAFKVMLNFAAPTFDVSVFEILYPLWKDRTLASCDRSLLLTDLENIINTLEIDAVELTPTVASMLDAKKVPNLKALLTIGEKLNDKVISEFGDSCLYNCYGPTEATVQCIATSKPVLKESSGSEIGTVLPAVGALIIDPNDLAILPLPLGWVGELAILGPQVSMGYLNRPQLNAEAFICHPTYGMVYRTGDLCRLGEHEHIMYKRRKNEDQVKLRGQRIELGEIESALNLSMKGLKLMENCNGISAVSVIDGNLYAIVETHDTATIASRISKILPSYMIPSKLITGKVSLLPSGKLDRKGVLATLEQMISASNGDHSEENESYEDPIWSLVSSEAYKLGGVFPTKRNTLIACGIDSIRTIRLARQLKSHGIPISSFATLFSCNTFDDLYCLLKSSDLKIADVSSIHSDHCSPIQMGLLLQTVSDETLYWNVCSFKVSLSYAVSDVIRAILQIFNANSIFRTAFNVSLDDFSIQRIVHATFPKEYINVVDIQDADSAVQSTLYYLRGQNFDCGPAARIILSKGTEYYRLELIAHHALHDGWSLELFVSDLTSILSDVEVPIRPQYNELLLSELHKVADDFYWESLMKGYSSNLHFKNLPTGQHLNNRFSTVTYPLADNLVKTLAMASNELQTSRQVLYYYAWWRVMTLHYQVTDLALAIVATGRNIPIPDIDSIYGPFVAVLPLRYTAHDDTDIFSSIRQVHIQCQEMRLRYRPSTRISYIMQNLDILLAWQENILGADSELVSLVSSNDHVEYPLFVEAMVFEGQLSNKITFNQEALSRETIMQFVDSFHTVLLDICEICSGSLTPNAANTLKKNKGRASPAISSPTLTKVSAQRNSNGSGISEARSHTSLQYKRQYTIKIVSEALDLKRKTLDYHVPLKYLGFSSFSAVFVVRKLRHKGIANLSLLDVLRAESCQNIIDLVLGSSAPTSFKLPSIPLKKDLFCRESSALAYDTTCHTFSDDECIETIYPLTSIQKAMLARYLINSRVYINKAVLTFDEPVRLSRYIDALECVCAIFTVLRSKFAVYNDVINPFLQIVYKQRSLKILSSDMFSFSEWDFMEYPLVFVSKCSLVPDTTVDELVCYFHHSLLDAGSFHRVIDTINLILSDIELPAIDDEYVPALNLVLHLDNMKHLEPYALIADRLYPSLIEKCKYAQISSSNNELIHSIEFSIDKHIVDTALGHLSVSLTDISIFLWTCVLQQTLDQKHVTFGLAHSLDYLSEEISSPVGCFMNMLSLSTEINMGQSIPDFCDSVNKQISELLAAFPVSKNTLQQYLAVSDLYDTAVIVQPPRDLMHPVNVNSIEGITDLKALFEVEPLENNVKFTLQLDSSVGLGFLCEIVKQFTVRFFGLWFMKVNTKDLSTVFGSLIERSAPDVSIHVSTVPTAPSIENNGSIADNQVYRDIFHAMDGMSKLSNEYITPEVTFKELGIDSISMVSLFSRLKVSYSNIMPNTVLSAKTISELCSLVSQSSSLLVHDRRISDDLSDVIVEETESYLSYATHSVSQGLLYDFLKSEGRFGYALFNCSLKLAHESTALANGHLLDSLFQLCELHPILRTGFQFGERINEPLFRVSKALSRTDIASLIRWVTFTDENLDSELLEVYSSINENLSGPQWRILADRTCSNPLKFVWYINHAIMDAHSFSLILQDFSRLDQKLVEKEYNIGRGAKYFSEHFDRQIDSADAFEWWKEYLKPDSFTVFPALTPTFKQNGFDQVSRSLDIDVSRLSSVSSGIPASAILATSWALTLGHLLGTDLVCFGYLQNFRSSAVILDNCELPCFKVLPFVLSLEGHYIEIFQRASDNLSSLADHGRDSLSHALKRTGLGSEVLFDTLLAIQIDQILGQDAFSAQSSFQCHSSSSRDKFPVSVELSLRASGSIKCNIFFSMEKLSEDNANVIMSIFENIVKHIVAKPNALGLAVFPELPLSIVPPRIKSYVTPFTYLPGLLLDSFTAKENEVALEMVYDFSEKSVVMEYWTYRQLYLESLKVANFLISLELPRNTPIALCFERCPYASFAMVGVLLAGHAIVPLDAKAPAERKNIYENLSDLGVSVVNIEADQNVLRSSTTVPTVDARLNDICYILYTSGSTGNPKGCIISNENAVQGLLAFEDQFRSRTTSESRLLAFASYHFDVSILEHFWSWMTGITLVTCSHDLILRDLSETLKILKISHVDLTPSLASTLSPAGLRILQNGIFITGGEMLKREILENWGSFGCIYNAYGPTEATIGVSIRKHVPCGANPNNVGFPFANVGLLILKPGTTEAVPQTAIGEVCLFGPLVGQGYVNRVSETEKSFVQLDLADSIVYRTGDMGRILADNSLCITGRIDSQIKLRGQRLEASEVESVIKSSRDDVSAVCVQTVRKGSSDQLVAYIVLGPAKSRDSEILSMNRELTLIADYVKDVCSKALPPYMIPSFVVFLTRLPITRNNKTDNKLLKEMFRSLDSSFFSASENMPSNNDSFTFTDTEAIILECLSSLLDISTQSVASPTVSLFELGLDSILAIALANRLKPHLKNASVSVIMSNPRLCDLSAALTSDTGFSEVENIDIEVKEFDLKLNNDLNVDCLLRCSAIQESILAHYFISDSSGYCTLFEYSLHESIDPEKLTQVFSILAERCEILRSGFAVTSTGPVRVVYKHYIPSVSFVELSQGEVNRFPGFSNLELPPYRIEIVQYSNSKRSLRIYLFHGLFDAGTMQLLEQRLCGLYHDLNYEFHDTYQTALRSALSYNIHESKKFWSAYLAHTPLLAFKNFAAAGENAEFLTSTVDVDISLLRKKAKGFSTTANIMLHAIWALYLGILCNGRMVSYGTIFSGRHGERVSNAEEACGPLFNILPVAIGSLDGASLASLCSRVHNYMSSCYPFYATKPADIKKWAGIDINLRLFDILFTVVPDHKVPVELSIWNKRQSVSFSSTFPLAVEIYIGEALEMTISINLSLCDRKTGNIILNDFTALLKQILRCESIKTLDVSLPNSKGLLSPLLTISHSADQTKTGSYSERDEEELSTNLSPSLIKIIQATTECPETIGPATTLVSLGLDSLSLVTICTRIRRVLSINIPLKEALAFKVLADFQRYLNAHYDSGSVPGETLAKRLSLLDKIPCTLMQAFMVSEMRKSLNNNYVTYVTFSLKGGIDIGRLEYSWRNVINANSILRTSISEYGYDDLEIYSSGYYLKVGAKFSENTSIFRRVYCSADNIEWFRSSLIKSERNVFLDDAPLLTLWLIDTGECYYLHLRMCHVIYDAISWNLMFSEVEKYYYNTCEAYTLPDYSSLLARILTENASIVGTEALDHYANARVTSFPKLAKIDTNPQANHYKVNMISAISSTTLKDFARVSEVSIQAIAYCCWSVLLKTICCESTEQFSPIFMTVLANRTTEEEMNTMFPAMKSTVLYGATGGTIKSMLCFMEKLVDVTRQGNIDIRETVKKCSTDHSAEVDTLFLYQAPVSEKQAESSLWTESFSSSEVQYPVAAEMQIVGRQLMWRMSANASYLTESDLNVLVRQLDTVLHNIVSVDENLGVKSLTDYDTSLLSISTPVEIGQNQNSIIHFDTMNEHRNETACVEISSALGCEDLHSFGAIIQEVELISKNINIAVTNKQVNRIIIICSSVYRQCILSLALFQSSVEDIFIADETYNFSDIDFLDDSCLFVTDSLQICELLNQRVLKYTNLLHDSESIIPAPQLRNLNQKFYIAPPGHDFSQISPVTSSDLIATIKELRSSFCEIDVKVGLPLELKILTTLAMWTTGITVLHAPWKFDPLILNELILNYDVKAIVCSSEVSACLKFANMQQLNFLICDNKLPYAWQLYRLQASMRHSIWLHHGLNQWPTLFGNVTSEQCNWVYLNSVSPKPYSIRSSDGQIMPLFAKGKLFHNSLPLDWNFRMTSRSLVARTEESVEISVPAMLLSSLSDLDSMCCLIDEHCDELFIYYTLRNDKDDLDEIIDAMNEVLISMSGLVLKRVPKKVSYCLVDFIAPLPGGYDFDYMSRNYESQEVYLYDLVCSFNKSERRYWDFKLKSLIAAVIPEFCLTDMTDNVSVFDLGLDSIRILKLASKLTADDCPVSAGELIGCRYVTKMVSLAHSRYLENPAMSNTVLPAAKDAFAQLATSCNLNTFCSHVLPLYAGQVYTLSGWEWSNHEVFLYKFEYFIKNIAPSALERAWNKLVCCRAILRTLICNSSSVRNPVVQGVLKQDEYIKGKPKFKNPFCEFEIIRSDSDGTTFSIVLHHALYDAWSLHGLLADLEKLCNNESVKDDNEATLVLASQRMFRASSSRLFWKQYLSGAYAASFMCFSGSPMARTGFFEELGLPRLRHVEKLVREKHVSLQAYITACIGRVLLHFSSSFEPQLSSDKGIIGLYYSGRFGQAISNLDATGIPTMNVLPLVVQTKKDVFNASSAIDDFLAEVSGKEFFDIQELKECADITGPLICVTVNFLPEILGSSHSPIKHLRTDVHRLNYRNGNDAAIPEFAHLNDLTGCEAIRMDLDIEIKIDRDRDALAVGLFSWEEVCNKQELKILTEKINEEVFKELHT
ncbi:hypothetical protein CANCADRAFT_1757 [Tortispora caseinolytica NRRL Y-17796]|uniref:Carrier domain-containing protein n=1 Tax=Tortispora caseinolytica NRRL Y-17796 TaxID=767744 RepID=A0A1E4TEB9_9ASCO|nr:hypothetical protein CANCADRAFT_1757 [Tortispora caseinolytica NRRL Y-17796]